jgi:hypothetical protein
MFNKNFALLVAVTILLTFAWLKWPSLQVEVAITSEAEAQYVKEGLLGYWPFDVDTIKGETVKDVFGNNDGTIKGAPKIVEGKVKEALEFNGATDYVSTNLLVSPKEYKELTMEAWAKPYIIPNDWDSVMNGDDGNWDRGFGLRGKKWEVQVGRASGDWQPDTEVDLKEWQHLVAVYGVDKVVFYKNGERFDYHDAGTIAASVQPLVIGEDIPCGNCYFQGAIDEVRVYGRALSENEVLKNFAAKGAAVEYSTEKLSLTWGKIKG